MLRALLRLLGLRGDSDDAETDSDEDGDDEEGGFIPSRLDASVLESHGMGTTEAERELESIEEKAEILESERPDEHRHEHGK